MLGQLVTPGHLEGFVLGVERVWSVATRSPGRLAVDGEPPEVRKQTQYYNENAGHGQFKSVTKTLHKSCVGENYSLTWRQERQRRKTKLGTSIYSILDIAINAVVPPRKCFLNDTPPPDWYTL